MRDEQIVEVAAALHAGGFLGVVAWHHYNEPLLAWDRIVALQAAIRTATPQARFLLWTNGDRLTQEIAAQCDTLVITNYAERDLAPFRQVCADVREIKPALDWRLNPPVVAPTRTPPCVRPFLEIVFDYYGNVRTCCMDWRGETSIGNIHDTPFPDLWQRWVRQRGSLAASPMGMDAPHRCQTCGTRYVHLAHYVSEPAARALVHLTASPTP